MAIGLLDRTADRRADMCEEQRRADVTGELKQVLIVPGRLGAVKQTGCIRSSVPPDAKPVAVGGLGPEPGTQALMNQRVRSFIEHVLEEDGSAGVCEPAAHARLLS